MSGNRKASMRDKQMLADMKPDQLLVSNRTISKASAPFIRDCIIPLFEELEGISVDIDHEPFGVDEALKRYTPQASGLELGGLVGVVVFLGGWAATKVLDEIYDQTLGPALKKHLGSYLSARTIHQKYALSLVIGVGSTQVTILIAAVGKTAAEVEVSEQNVRSVLTHATQFAQEHSSEREVHLYVIDGARIDVQPRIFESLSSAMSALEGKAVKPLRNVK